MTTQQETRRSVPGRRANQANGMLYPVKKEVPRSGARDRKYFPCDGIRCKRKTTADPNAEGERLCHACKPRPLQKGKVWRLCVKCDYKMQKGPNDRGPFLCTWCKRRSDFGHYHTVTHGNSRPPSELSAESQRRCDQLGAMYAAAMAYPSETAARNAGLKTRSEELPWGLTSDAVTSADAEDEDDAS